MGFVLDASTTIAWVLDAADRRAVQAWAKIREDSALVPTLWWFEVRNALVVNERRGRISERQTGRFLKQLTQQPIAIDTTPDESAVLTLSRRHRLTVYDAAYLELALRAASPLATLDAMLADAARAETVHVIGDDAQ